MSQEQTETREAKVDPHVDPMVRSTRALVVVTAALAIASLLTDLILYLQFGAMRGQLEEMHSSSRQTEEILALYTRLATAAEEQNRPYVVVDWKDVVFKTGETPSVQLSFKNGGRTPALNLKFWIAVLVKPRPFSPYIDEKFATYRSESSAIFPNRELYITAQASGALSKKKPPTFLTRFRIFTSSYVARSFTLI